MSSNNKSVIVTGASKGIGKAIALAAAAAGYDLTVHYNKDQPGAQAVVDQAIKLGVKAHLLSFDISNRQECRVNLLNDIENHGVYYGVICNAGIAADNAFPSITDEQWDKVIHTNLDGFYNVLHPLIMPMVQTRKPGRIITLSSVSGMIGNRGQVNYSAAKAGIIGATKALAVEMGKRNITANCIAPGVIETDMIGEVPEDQILPSIPLRRFGKPDEVAGLAIFLLSASAAYITRQVIAVNGGLI